LTDTSIAAAIDVLASTPATMRALLAEMPDEIVAARDDEGWSARDVLAHLVSLNGPALLDRVGLMLEQDDPPIPNVDEQALLDRSGLRSRPVAVLLEEFARQRAGAAAWLRGLPPEALARTGRHSVAGRLTVAEVVHHKAWHDLLHVRQVCALLAAPLDEQRGAMRMFT